MCLCLSTLASTVWKKNCLFIYNVQSWKKVGVIFPVILGRFSFASHATSFFIHSLSSFFLSAYTLLFSFTRVSYLQISDMIPGMNIIDGKVSAASFNGAGGSGGVLRSQQGF